VDVALLVVPPRENTVVHANAELTYEDVVMRDYVFSKSCVFLLSIYV
jgi:hypothetical protein